MKLWFLVFGRGGGTLFASVRWAKMYSLIEGAKSDMSLLKRTLEINGKELSRRCFLKVGALAALACASPRLGFAAVGDCLQLERSLSFYNTHTGEHLEAVYWSGGEYVPTTLADINYILRDHRTGEVKPINTRVLDLLFAMRVKLKPLCPFHVISGYRSPKTNAFLRNFGRGVGKKSLHMCGKAIDIRLPGLSLSLVHRVAMDLKAGGVGYYPRSNFIHVDVGRLRYW